MHYLVLVLGYVETPVNTDNNEISCTSFVIIRNFIYCLKGPNVMLISVRLIDI